MNLKVNSIRNELSIYKEKEQKNSRTQSTPSVHSKLGGTSRTFQDTSTQTEAVLLANPELPSRSTGNTPKIMMYTYKNKQEKRVEFDYINKNHSLIRELSYNQSDDDARHNNSTFQRSVTFNTSVMQNTTVFSSHASSENLIVEGMGIEDSTQLSDQEHDVTASIRNNESKRSKRSKIKKRLMNWICISK